MKRTSFFTALVVTISLMASSGQAASDLPSAAQKALKQAALPEVPAQAAELVVQTRPAERTAVAEAIALYVAEQHPAALPQTLSAIIQAKPSIGPYLVAVLAEKYPARAESLAVTGTQAAPKFSDLIAMGAAKAQPKKAVNIAQSVRDVVPDATLRVYSAVAYSVPEASSELQTTISSFAQQDSSGMVTSGPGFGVEQGELKLVPTLDEESNTGSSELRQAVEGNVQSDAAAQNVASYGDLGATLRGDLDQISSNAEGNVDLSAELDTAFEGATADKAVIWATFLQRLETAASTTQLDKKPNVQEPQDFGLEHFVEIELRRAVNQGRLSQEQMDEILERVTTNAEAGNMDQAKAIGLRAKINYASP